MAENTIKDLVEITRAMWNADNTEDDYYSVSKGEWQVSRGGYNLAYEVYKNGIAVVDVDDRNRIYQLNDSITKSEFKQIMDSLEEGFDMKSYGESFTPYKNSQLDKKLDRETMSEFSASEFAELLNNTDFDGFEIITEKSAEQILKFALENNYDFETENGETFSKGTLYGLTAEAEDNSFGNRASLWFNELSKLEKDVSRDLFQYRQIKSAIEESSDGSTIFGSAEESKQMLDAWQNEMDKNWIHYEFKNSRENDFYYTDDCYVKSENAGENLRHAIIPHSWEGEGGLDEWEEIATADLSLKEVDEHTFEVSPLFTKYASILWEYDEKTAAEILNGGNYIAETALGQFEAHFNFGAESLKDCVGEVFSSKEEAIKYLKDPNNYSKSFTPRNSQKEYYLGYVNDVIQENNLDVTIEGIQEYEPLPEDKISNYKNVLVQYRSNDNDNPVREDEFFNMLDEKMSEEKIESVEFDYNFNLDSDFNQRLLEEISEYKEVEDIENDNPYDYDSELVTQEKQSFIDNKIREIEDYFGSSSVDYIDGSNTDYDKDYVNIHFKVEVPEEYQSEKEFKEWLENVQDDISSNYGGEENSSPYYSETRVHDRIDFNPITAEKSGTIEQYLERLEEQKREELRKENPEKAKAFDFAVEKLKVAGIEVVQNKGEFERILESKDMIQKSVKGLTDEQVNKYFSFDSDDVAKFNSHIDDYENGVLNPRVAVIVGKIPAVMKAIGIPDKPIGLDYSVIDKVLRPEPVSENDLQGHNLSLEDVRKIPHLLADPVMVFNSRTRNDSFVFFTEHKDKDGESIVIPLAVKKRKNNIVINAITSMYGKDNEQNFVYANLDKLRYIDKKRSLDWEKKISHSGKHLTQVQFLRERFTDQNDSINNILTKDRLVKFLTGTQYMTRENTVYGFTHEGKIYLNPDVLSSNIPIHEYTHLWDKYTENTNPELWEKGKETFKQTSLWNEVISDPNYEDIKDDETLVLSECHARICGNIAEKVLERIASENGEIAKDAVINWDKEVWTYIAENYSHDITKFASVADFMTLPMKDFWNEKDISVKQVKEISSEKIKNFIKNNDIYINDVNETSEDNEYIVSYGVSHEFIKELFPTADDGELYLTFKKTGKNFDVNDIEVSVTPFTNNIGNDEKSKTLILTNESILSIAELAGDREQVKEYFNKYFNKEEIKNFSFDNQGLGNFIGEQLRNNELPDETWSDAVAWGYVNGNHIGAEYNLSYDRDVDDSILNQSAIYLMTENKKTGYIDTDHSTFIPYEIDFDDENWEKKLEEAMKTALVEFSKEINVDHTDAERKKAEEHALPYSKTFEYDSSLTKEAKLVDEWERDNDVSIYIDVPKSIIESDYPGLSEAEILITFPSSGEFTEKDIEAEISPRFTSKDGNSSWGTDVQNLNISLDDIRKLMKLSIYEDQFNENLVVEPLEETMETKQMRAAELYDILEHDKEIRERIRNAEKLAQNELDRQESTKDKFFVTKAIPLSFVKGDENLFAIQAIMTPEYVAQQEGSYTEKNVVWTTFNAETESLNNGHYYISTEAADRILKNSILNDTVYEKAEKITEKMIETEKQRINGIIEKSGKDAYEAGFNAGDEKRETEEHGMPIPENFGEQDMTDVYRVESEKLAQQNLTLKKENKVLSEHNKELTEKEALQTNLLEGYKRSENEQNRKIAELQDKVNGLEYQNKQMKSNLEYVSAFSVEKLQAVAKDMLEHGDKTLGDRFGRLYLENQKVNQRKPDELNRIVSEAKKNDTSHKNDGGYSSY